MVLALAVATVNQLHLPVLQVVAWSGMLVSYSQDTDVATAVEMTFNGENPCPMCTAIKAQQLKSNADQLQAASTQAQLFYLEVPVAWFSVTSPLARLADTPRVAHECAYPPETPPPRLSA